MRDKILSTSTRLQLKLRGPMLVLKEKSTKVGKAPIGVVFHYGINATSSKERRTSVTRGARETRAQRTRHACSMKHARGQRERKVTCKM